MESKEKMMLIVDDVALNRAILVELFYQEYQVLEAKNGEEAIEIISRYGERLSIILLDLIMPVMDGFGVLQKMRENKWIGRIPVIMITTEANEKTTLKGYDLGVCEIINKPFNPKIVRRRVENLVELYAHKFQLEKMLGDQMAVLEKQAQRIKQTNIFLIDTLSTIVEFRNCESGLHIKRMRKITKILLEEISHRCPEYRLTLEKIEIISGAAAMHDIGKISIPDYVLTKPGKLTTEEFEVMKTHAVRGCEILQRLGYMQDEEYYDYCYEICRHHHERWDGNGYPDGLKGEEIPIWAQAVSLADVYEALISERVYKPRYSHQKAMFMIINGECGVFNPLLMDCFVGVQKKLRHELTVP